MLVPAFLGCGLLLALVGSSLGNPSGGAYWCRSPPFSSSARCSLCRAGASPFPVEGPVGVVPHPPGLGPFASFGGLGGPNANPSGGPYRCTSSPFLTGA